MLRLFSLLFLSSFLPFVFCRDSSSGPPTNQPKWPLQFQARFGLYQFDGLTPGDNNPIFNETSLFYYDFNVTNSQLIVYPERCTPILPNADNSPCSILFTEPGIYFSAPALDIPCCLLIAGVGPTPPDFLRGFTWNSTATAPDYYGQLHNTNYWVSADESFKYWTETNTNHDIFFRDGGGAFWAWDHLNVTAQSPSTFAPFSDPTTCAKPCGSEMSARASKINMIQLAIINQAAKEEDDKIYQVEQ